MNLRPARRSGLRPNAYWINQARVARDRFDREEGPAVVDVLGRVEALRREIEAGTARCAPTNNHPSPQDGEGPGVRS